MRVKIDVQSELNEIVKRLREQEGQPCDDEDETLGQWR